MPFRFSVNYDYRCPFARNMHEHVVEGLRSGADWEVEFVPFSLTQPHIEEGQPSVWDDPARAGDLLAIEAGMVVLERFPEQFLPVHLELFAARHDHGGDVRDEAVVRKALTEGGADADAVLDAVRAGVVHEAFRKAHESAVDGRRVFGVPTFVVGDQAVFVRVMHRPQGDGDVARATVEDTIQLIVERPQLNEFKHTTIRR